MSSNLQSGESLMNTSFSNDTDSQVQKLGALFMILFAASFLTLKISTHHLNKFHFLYIGSIFGCYFLHPLTRKLVVITFPMAVYGLMYDFFQYIPFQKLMPIRVAEPYNIDLKWFGIPFNGQLLHLNQFLFQHFQNPVLDVYCGFIYMLHVPVVIALVLIFWRFSSDELAARFIFAFWVMNVFAFATYYYYPSAAPWFVAKYGFLQPLAPMPGDAAGLVRFDQILHLNLFTQNYQISPVPFGAIPSMHAGFSTLGFLYSLQFNRKLSVVLGIYCVSMWFSALYLQHHYLIDLVLGIFYAFLAFMFVELVLKKSFLKVFCFLRKNLIEESKYTLLGKY